MILIRADANEYIGTGHVMRCISIARAFADIGENSIFITADQRSDSLIHENGFSTYCLNSIWTDMESELGCLTDYIINYQPKLLLVDSYSVTEQYFHKLAKLTKLAYMDDLNKAAWDVDYLINYNIYASKLNYSWYEGTRTKLLLTPVYTPLRKEFRNLPVHSVKETVTDIFVSAGGADPEQIIEKLINELCPEWNEIAFHFVVGALNPRVEVIKSLAKKHKNVALHIHEKHMAELMMRCDIAISAAGSTLYELCAAGTPTITFVLADNQKNSAEEFEKQGVMLNIGDCSHNSFFSDCVKRGLTFFVKDRGKRMTFSRKMQSIVTGDGTSKIVFELLNYC